RHTSHGKTQLHYTIGALGTLVLQATVQDSARPVRMPNWAGIDVRLAAEPLVERTQDGGRDEARHISAAARHLFDQAGRQERVRVAGGYEHGVHIGQTVVHLRHLQFVIEVGHGAQALDDRRNLMGGAIVHQQAAEGDNGHVRHSRGGFAQEVQTLVYAAQSLLRFVYQDGDHDVVE